MSRSNRRILEESRTMELQNRRSLQVHPWYLSSQTAPSPRESQQTYDNRNHDRKKLCGCWHLCAPCCVILFVFAVLLLAIGITFILLAIIPKEVTMATSTMSSTSLLISSVTLTTTAQICLSSCLNRTWISSAGLMAKWTFDGTFNDQTNTYNAFLGIAPSFVNNGYVNQAAQFNPANLTHLYTPYLPLINASFTVEVWLYPTAFPNAFDHSILGQCVTTPGGNNCLHLTIRNFAGVYRLYMSFFGDNCRSTLSVSLNQWVHAAFIFDLATYSMLIYQDGVLGGSCVSAQPLLGSGANGIIGYVPQLVPSLGANFFQGYIDQLGIYSRVKPSCEILDDATLTTYYSFDINPTVDDDGPNSLSSVAHNVSYTRSGHLSKAISFNTNISYFEIHNLTGLGITNKPFSISLWIRPFTLSGTLVYVHNGSLSLNWCMSFLGFAANHSLVSQVWAGSLRVIFGPVLSTSSVWHHVVQTWSSTNGLRLYVDNNLVGINSLVTSYVASGVSNHVIIANRPINSCTQGAIVPPYQYSGDVDDFRVYSRELSPADICALHNY